MAMANLTNSPVVALLAENDMEQAREFWRDVVGLPEVYFNKEYQEAAYEAGGTIFAIYAHQGGSSADHTQIAFQVQNVGETVNGLRELGVHFEEYSMPQLKTVNGIADMGDGGQGAWFKDPGGNIVGLFTASERLTRAVQRSGQMAGATMGG